MFMSLINIMIGVNFTMVNFLVFNSKFLVFFRF
ncbi:Uncharacterised protein [Yersinia kristensenii]|nr:Uncharacterised protein [Yersinia kristensenii]